MPPVDAKIAEKPKLAVYKFSSCDGCQLSILNLEDELLDLVECGRSGLFSRSAPAGPAAAL